MCWHDFQFLVVYLTGVYAIYSQHVNLAGKKNQFISYINDVVGSQMLIDTLDSTRINAGEGSRTTNVDKASVLCS
jgi:hypothetical protein